MGVMARSVLVYISIISGALAEPKIHPGRVHVGVNLNLVDPAKESQSVAANASSESSRIDPPPPARKWNFDMENAIRNGDVEKAKQLINSGVVDVNAYSPNGPGANYYIDYAIWSYHGEYVRVFCDLVDCHNGPAHPESAVPIIRLLLEAGANINNTDQRPAMSHLHDIIDEIEIAELLIQHGINVNKANFWGRTPLAELFAQGVRQRPKRPNLDNRLKIVELYIRSGAEINSSDDCKKTPLYHAERSRIQPDNPAIIPFLESHGAVSRCCDFHYCGCGQITEICDDWPPLS